MDQNYWWWIRLSLHHPPFMTGRQLHRPPWMTGGGGRQCHRPHLMTGRQLHRPPSMTGGGAPSVTFMTTFFFFFRLAFDAYFDRWVSIKSFKLFYK
jgi:hypothetical protein